MPVTSQPITFTVKQSGALQTALSPAHRVSAVLQVHSCLLFFHFLLLCWFTKFFLLIYHISQPKNIFLNAVFFVIAVVTRDNIQFTVLRISQYPIMPCDYWWGVFDLLWEGSGLSAVRMRTHVHVLRLWWEANGDVKPILPHVSQPNQRRHQNIPQQVNWKPPLQQTGWQYWVILKRLLHRLSSCLKRNSCKSI